MKRGRELRPLSLPAKKTWARKVSMAIDRLEKLAQEGLRGNSDRLAAGKRIGSEVREAA